MHKLTIQIDIEKPLTGAGFILLAALLHTIATQIARGFTRGGHTDMLQKNTAKFKIERD